MGQKDRKIVMLLPPMIVSQQHPQPSAVPPPIKAMELRQATLWPCQFAPSKERGLSLDFDLLFPAINAGSKQVDHCLPRAVVLNSTPLIDVCVFSIVKHTQCGVKFFQMIFWEKEAFHIAVQIAESRCVE